VASTGRDLGEGGDAAVPEGDAAVPGGDAAVFHPRPPRWRLRRGDLLLCLDLPCTGVEPFFDVLAGFFRPDEVRSSRRWPRHPDDLALVADDVRGARVMRAHVDYEFYRFLPRTPVYVTILRDPVERIVALYECVRSTPEHPYHQRVTAGHLSLYEFVCEPAFAGDVVDVQARRIAGGMFRDPAASSDQVLLQTARANLGEFAFFGTADWLEQAVLLLAYTFGWPFPRDLVRGGPRAEAASREGLAPAALEAIEARTRVDHALVQFAREQFTERVRTALFDLLDQNALASEPYLTLLEEQERLQTEYAQLQRAWSWKVARRLRDWRQAVAPSGSRRDRWYQRLGTYVFDRDKSER